MRAERILSRGDWRLFPNIIRNEWLPQSQCDGGNFNYLHHNVMMVTIFSKWSPSSHCDEGNYSSMSEITFLSFWEIHGRKHFDRCYYTSMLIKILNQFYHGRHLHHIVLILFLKVLLDPIKKVKISNEK